MRIPERSFGPLLKTRKRLRLTFSWDACALDDGPGGESTLGTDYDVFLFNETLGEGYYASQTFDDNNEGFDVDILEGWEGDYRILLVWPQGTTGCYGGDDRYGVVVSVW